MRRLAGIALVSGVVLAGTAAPAWAAPQPIVGQADNTFSAPSYDLAGGTVGTLTVTGSLHNVTAPGKGPDGKNLFRSATISGGSTPVDGTQYLAPGSYPFNCTIHPLTMSATLVVTGTPLPRPTATVKVLSKSLDKVASKGKLKVSTASASAAVHVEAHLGTDTIGTAEGPPGAIRVKLFKGARKKLAKKSSAKVTVSAAPEFGVPGTASRKLK
jgi:plastocyanin